MRGLAGCSDCEYDRDIDLRNAVSDHDDFQVRELRVEFPSSLIQRGKTFERCIWPPHRRAASDPEKIRRAQQQGSYCLDESPLPPYLLLDLADRISAYDDWSFAAAIAAREGRRLWTSVSWQFKSAPDKQASTTAFPRSAAKMHTVLQRLFSLLANGSRFF